MKIKSVRWENFKGLPDNQIAAEGNNVVIRGQNGVGKSSVAQILPFVLFGKIVGSVKKFDNGLPPTDDGLIHAAEIIFDDGSSLRREYFWNNQGNCHQLFINGKPAKSTQFKTYVEKITNGGGELVFNPFAFVELSAKDQRALLVKIFGDIRDSDVANDDEKKLLDGLNAEMFIAQAKNKLINPKRELNDIPARLSELNIQLADIPDNIQKNIADIKSKLAELKAQREKFSQPLPHTFKDELDEKTRQAILLKQGIGVHKKYIDHFNSILQKLREDYKKVRNQEPGTCPYCKQKMPLDFFFALRGEKLTELEIDGDKVKADLQNREELRDKLSNDLITTENQIKELEVKARDEADKELNRRNKLAELDNSINDLQASLLKLKNASDIQKRIDALTAREIELSNQIDQIDTQIKIAENIQQRKIESLESKINSHFQHVKFKLFNVTITTGELKPTCEPMLHGVPYSGLSKGERLKAVLDIFKVIQNFFGVEMPLFIDDAESYTLNSFVELPNQIWLFKVSDETELTINIGG